MYSIRAIFDKHPSVIAEAVRTILFTLVLAGVLNMSDKLLAGIALAVSVVLSLFVWNAVTPTKAPRLEAGTEVEIIGTEETTTIGER